MANRIVVANQQVVQTKLDKNIIWEYKALFLPKLIITVLKDSILTLQIEEMVDCKLEIEIHICKDQTLTLVETKTGQKGKIQLSYYLDTNSSLKVSKIHDVSVFHERDFFFLDGYSKVTSVLKTVVTEKEKYDMTISHKAGYSESHIINHGVDQSGVLTFNVTTSIPNHIKKCVANQANRIINLTNNHCVIRPNLLIDEYDVEANHSAYIGPFHKNEMFYIERLGLPSDLALKVLTQSFMNSKIDCKEIKILEKYWR